MDTKSKYKVVVIDIDGTFIDDNEILPSENLSIFNSITQKGINAIFCSGRMLQSVEKFLKINIGKVFPIIAYNGAMTKFNGEIIIDKKIPSTFASLIVKEVLEEKYYIQAYVNDELFVSEDNEKAADYARHSNVAYYVPDDLLDFVEKHEPTKLLIIDEPELLEGIGKEFREKFNEVEIVKSFPTYLDIIPANVDKGRALKALCETMGILPEQTIVIGDNDNDVPAFKIAGLSIAMENGTKSAKENADIIAPSNNDAGFAKIIEQLIGKNYL